MFVPYETFLLVQGLGQEFWLKLSPELSTIMPSILTDAEIDLLKSSVSETLLKMLFRNGVLLVEARTRDDRTLPSFCSCTALQFQDRTSPSGQLLNYSRDMRMRHPRRVSLVLNKAGGAPS
jgi:hypothetical protein